MQDARPIVVRRADRSFVRVHGRDPVRMIQGLITNDIASAAPGRAVYAAMLTAKGKMVADVRVLRRGDELLLETHADAAAAMLAHLRKFVPPLFAKFEDVSAAWSELTVAGAGARAHVARAANVSLPATEDAAVDATLADVPAVLITTSYADDACDAIIPAAATDAALRVLRAHDITEADADMLEVLRVEAGTPRWGAELDDGTIPLEAGLRQRAISETKGCYTGQEVIIRILHRGHVNRLLRGVLLGDIAPPARGTALVNDDGRDVGRITSAVRSMKHGQTIALAYVRREVTPPALLHLETPTGAAAAIAELPLQLP